MSRWATYVILFASQACGCLWFDTGAVELADPSDAISPPDSGMDVAPDAVVDSSADLSAPDDGVTDADQGGCIPESAEAFCARAIAQCGEVTAADNCGTNRTQPCGNCTAPATCGGGGTPNVCACSDQTDTDFCAAMGSACGATTGVDECGLERTTNCGMCTAPETCGGAGVANQCGCAPESDAAFCDAAGVMCESHMGTDSCGVQRTANCGACMSGRVCMAGTCVSDGSCGNGVCDPGEDMSCPQDCGVVVSISAGSGQTCAVRSDATLWCWGSNSKGEYGDGSTGGSLIPHEIVAAGLVDQVSAGNKFTCIIAATGEARCTGDNKNGRLGANLSDKGESALFVDVVGMAGATDISAGTGHGCAVASGAGHCWGLNKSGALGDGSSVDTLAPVAVLGGLTFSQISAGDDFSCGVTTNFLPYCWGANGAGQLGDATLVDRTVPTAVAGLTNVRSVSAGGSHACALLDSGAVRCWGNGLLGQLGNGAAASSSTAVPVSGLSGVEAIDCGTGHCCAIAGGVVSCWGDSAMGQAGQNGGTVTTPAAVGVSGATAVTAGSTHSCAAVGGGARCWGTNLTGELGDGGTTNSPSPVNVAFP